MEILTENTLFVGKVAIHLQSVPSTNAYAWELVSKNTPIEGTVIWADIQTAGRGQIGSRWESAPNENITATFILCPSFLLASQQFLLNQAIALGVRDWLVALGVPSQRVFIKWSNDIYIDDKKLGGILIENVLRQNSLQYSIVGIGLNINQTVFAETLPNPISLAQTLHQTFDCQILLGKLCGYLEARYMQLRAGRRDELKAAYTQALYRYQEEADYEIIATQERVRGQIMGVGATGKLIVQIAGKLQEFDLKEIKFLIN